jgi:hypothetical protein
MRRLDRQGDFCMKTEDSGKKISHEVALELQLKQARGMILKLQHELAQKEALLGQCKAELLKVEAAKLDQEMTNFMNDNGLEDGSRIMKDETGAWIIKEPPTKAG